MTYLYIILSNKAKVADLHTDRANEAHQKGAFCWCFTEGYSHTSGDDPPKWVGCFVLFLWKHRKKLEPIFGKIPRYMGTFFWKNYPYTCRYGYGRVDILASAHHTCRPYIFSLDAQISTLKGYFLCVQLDKQVLIYSLREILNAKSMMIFRLHWNQEKKIITSQLKEVILRCNPAPPPPSPG